MVRVPSGWFWRGSDNHYEWERPRRRVFVDSFEIAAAAVTRREFAEFLTATRHEEPKGWADPAFDDWEQPVVGVSWFDALDYCEWRGEGFRLPTEAEWECASRGGRIDEEYAWGNEPPESLEYFQGPWPAPKPVATWRANGFGLFNMGENVHEWCRDWYASEYYAVSPERNPTGPETGARRVSRGGSWRHLVKGSRCAHRSSLRPEYRYTDYGFRIVRA